MHDERNVLVDAMIKLRSHELRRLNSGVSSLSELIHYEHLLSHVVEL